MNRNRTLFNFALGPGNEGARAALAGLRVSDAHLREFKLGTFISVAPALAADIAPAAPVEGFELRLKRQDPPMAPLDELVLLLHTAAEIEHSLMAQYLYAAYSLPDQSPQREWQETLISIARQEMGHLMATQNLLLSIGAPLNLEREDYPFNAFYPFPFKLEPLSISSLARYVLAEMPDPFKVPEANIPVLLADAGVEGSISRVGTLFVAIAELIGELSSDPVFADSMPFQAKPSDWIAGPYALALSTVASIAEASELLNAIAVQGEGPDEPDAGPPSHFRRFYAMYVAAKAHVAATGQPLAEALPIDPTVKDAQASGYLQHPIARAWGAAFNTRYRCLLYALEHQLSLPNDQEARGRLGQWALADMMALRTIAQLLKQRPQHEPLRSDNLGRSRLAGAPFELPQTLQMPNRPIDRWRQYRSLVAFHVNQLRELAEDDGLASQLADDAAERLKFVTTQLDLP